jgi:beta-glucosidase
MPARKRVALIGPLADDKGDMVGAWAGAGNDSDIVTLRQALAQRAQQLGTTLLYSKGTEIDGTSQAGFPEAVEAARSADVVILALGESGAMSGEAGSVRISICPATSSSFLKPSPLLASPWFCLSFRAVRWFLTGQPGMFPQSWRSGSPEPKPGTRSPMFSTEMCRPPASCP